MRRLDVGFPANVNETRGLGATVSLGRVIGGVTLPPAFGQGGPVAGTVAIKILGAAAAWPVAYTLRFVRQAAWLDGTVLRVQGAFRQCACDLSTARIVQVRTGGAGMGILTVQPATGARFLRVRLVTPENTPLPQTRRDALADALAAGRGLAADSVDLRQTVEWLRSPAA